jgi:hypothetical protein
MSSDVETLFSDPASLFFQSTLQGDARQNYRLLDAPLNEYVIGFTRWLVNANSLPVDWDWSQDWQWNNNQGALPSDRLLVASRWSLAIFTPISILLLFFAGKRLGGWLCGLLAAGLLAFNPLILLHTRRAMAESLIIFSVCLWLWSIQRKENKFQGVIAFICFNAKQSLLALVPAALLSPAYPDNRSAKFSIKKCLGMIFINGLLFIGLTYLANPVMWKDPFTVGQKMIEERQDFTRKNLAEWQVVAPEQVLDSPAERLVVMVFQLFFSNPAVDEIANYRQEILPQTENYFRLFGSNFLSGLVWGAIFVVLALFGLVLLVVSAFKPHSTNREIHLILIGFGLQLLLLLLTIPLPYQRYWLPVFPFFCLFSAFGVTKLIFQVKASRLLRK